MIEHLFFTTFYVVRKNQNYNDSVSFARNGLTVTLGFYIAALAFFVANLTGWLIIDEIAKFWPELHPTGKGFRATDGFAILTFIALMIWTKRVYATPERVNKILQRYGSLTDAQLKMERFVALWTYVSGIILALMVALTRFFPYLNYFIALHLLLVTYTNWRIYAKWYLRNPAHPDH